jgi:hypothetical protein
MPIDFPTGPTTGQVYTYLGKSWVYNGTGWDAPRADIIEYLPSLIGGNTFNGVQNFTTPIAVGSGGTGAATLASGGYLKGAGTSAVTSQSGIPAGDITSGTLGIARGGTGAATLASGGYLKGAGTSAVTSQSGIPAGDITSGLLDSARLSAGTILQVVTVTSSTSITSTSTSFITTGLTALITPRSTSSRILCLVSMPVVNNSASTASIYTLFRGTVADTNLGTANNPSFRGFGQAYNGSSQVRAIASWNFVDSPNTTSQTRYTVGFLPQSGGAEVMAEQRTGTLTLMEVAG